MKPLSIAAVLVVLVGCAGPDGRTDPLRTAGAGAALGAIGGLAAGAISRSQEEPRRSYRRGYDQRSEWREQHQYRRPIQSRRWSTPQRCDSYGNCW
jgi:hypothetical protein